MHTHFILTFCQYALVDKGSFNYNTDAFIALRPVSKGRSEVQSRGFITSEYGAHVAETGL